MTEEELVEKVAAAMYGRPLSKAHPDDAEYHRIYARAAIAAMREAGFVQAPEGKVPMWTYDPRKSVSGGSQGGFSR